MSKRTSLYEQGEKGKDQYVEREDQAPDPPKRATAAQMATRKIKTIKPRGRPAGMSSSFSQIGASNPFAFGAVQEQHGPNQQGAFGSTTNSFPPAQLSTPSNPFASSSFSALGGSNTSFNPQPPSSGFTFTAPPPQQQQAPLQQFAVDNPSSTVGTPTQTSAPSNPFASPAFTTLPQQQQVPQQQVPEQPAPEQQGAFSRSTSGFPIGGFAVSRPSGTLGTSAQPSAPSNPFTSSSLPALSGGSNTFNTGFNIQPPQEQQAPEQKIAFGGTTTSSFPPAQTSAPSHPLASSSFPTIGGGSNTINTGFSPQSQPPPQKQQASEPQSPFSGTTSGLPPAQTSAPSHPFASSTFLTFGGSSNTLNTSFNPQPPPPPQKQQQQQQQQQQQAPEQQGAFSSTTSSTTSGIQLALPSAPGNHFTFGALEQPAPEQQGAFGGSTTNSIAVSSSSSTPNLSFTNPTSRMIFSGAILPGNDTWNHHPGSSGFLTSQPKQQPTTGNQAQPNIFAPSSTGTSHPPPVDNQEGNQPFGGLPPPPLEPQPIASMPTLTGSTVQESSKGLPKVPKVPKVQVDPRWTKPYVSNATHPANIDELGKQLMDIVAELSVLNQKFKDKIINIPTTADWSSLSAWHSKTSTELVQKITTLKKQRALTMGITGTESSLSTKRKPEEDLNHDSPATTSSKKPRGGDSVSGPTANSFQPSESSSGVANPDAPATKTANIFGNVLSKSITSTFGNAPSKNAVPSFGSADSTKMFNKIMPSAPSSQKNPPLSNMFANALNRSAGALPPSQSTPQVPVFGNVSTGGSFLSQFKSAKTAEELAAERKAKAKAEDYDSDDETEEQWSARYDAAEAVKQKAAMAAPGFQVSITASTSKDKDSSKSVFSIQKAGGDSSNGENARIATGFGFQKASGDSSNNRDNARSAMGFDFQKASGDSSSKGNAHSSPGFKPSTNLFTTPKPANGASSNGLFGSRTGSPAPSSPGGGSVFDSPQVGGTPGGNIFGHLSSGSNNQNESDEDDQDYKQGENQQDDQDYNDEDEDAQTEGQSQDGPSSDAGAPTSASQRKHGESDTESDEYLEETMRRKKQETADAKSSLHSHITKINSSDLTQSDSEKDQATPKPSLASRITKTDPPQLNSDNDKTETDLSSSANDTKKKPFQFFDFGKVPDTAPIKKNSFFSGDQTFKPGTPIKFGGAPTQPSTTPSFLFQPASPSLDSFFNNSSFGGASAPAPPSWLAPTVGPSKNSSSMSSVFSSRAPTPLSADETSGKESNAEEANEGKDAQLILNTDLTSEEKADYEILFHTPEAIAKHQVVKDGKKTWETKCRGPLWMLKKKDTGKVLIRIRLTNGSTPVNCFTLPKMATKLAGDSKKMVYAHLTGKEGMPSTLLLNLKDAAIAIEFEDMYNKNL